MTMSLAEHNGISENDHLWICSFSKSLLTGIVDVLGFDYHDDMDHKIGDGDGVDRGIGDYGGAV